MKNLVAPHASILALLMGFDPATAATPIAAKTLVDALAGSKLVAPHVEDITSKLTSRVASLQGSTDAYAPAYVTELERGIAVVKVNLAEAQNGHDTHGTAQAGKIADETQKPQHVG